MISVYDSNSLENALNEQRIKDSRDCFSIIRDQIKIYDEKDDIFIELILYSDATNTLPITKEDYDEYNELEDLSIALKQLKSVDSVFSIIDKFNLESESIECICYIYTCKDYNYFCEKFPTENYDYIFVFTKDFIENNKEFIKNMKRYENMRILFIPIKFVCQNLTY